MLKDSMSVKPYLMEQAKNVRLKFAFEHVNFVPHKLVYEFKNVKDVIHVDEKWFHIMKEKETFFLSPCEEEPHCRSKIKH